MSTPSELKKCMDKIDELIEIIKKKDEDIKAKDEEIDALREHQLFLETERPQKGKRKRIDWDKEPGDDESCDLKSENESLKTEIETLKKRLGITKKGSIPKEDNKEKNHIDTKELKNLIETKLCSGFKEIQENMTNLINEKLKSVANDVKFENTPGPSSMGTPWNLIVDKNTNKNNLRTIMVAQQNEERAEKSEKERRKNNIILHGKREPASDNDSDLEFSMKLVEALQLGQIELKKSRKDRPGY